MAGRRTFFFEGLGVSEGIAIGPAYVIESEDFRTESWQIEESEVEAELQRFHEAVGLAAEELRGIRQQVLEKIDRQQASIFDAHLLILEDPQIVDETVRRIRHERRNAEAVLWEVTQQIGEMMKSLGDSYFAERNHDLYDVSRRVIKFLLRIYAESHPALPREGCIVVANGLGPAETAQFSKDHVLGICTNEGAATSHAAIMAKAFSIPACVGLEHITHYIRSGDMLVLDGGEGKVILNPTADQIEFYREKGEVWKKRLESLRTLRDVPAITLDGVTISMMANLEFPEELDTVDLNGAEGIGLFRTEFMYLERTSLPTEEEHLRSYGHVLAKLGDKPVVMRTIDIGGDKLPSDQPVHEFNPFMGVRAIRLCLQRPDLFRAQLRAMAMAHAGRELNIMIPMISGLTELRESRNILDDILERLDREGVNPPSKVNLGAMIEIPSAALQTRTLCEEADFLSIGTNDLVQYTLAVDRVNKAVASLYRQTHPAVLQLISMVVEGAKETRTPVSVCGEMASDPKLAVLLVGLGIRSLSMSPSSIGAVKQVLRGLSCADAEAIAAEALRQDTPEDVEVLLHFRLKELQAKIDHEPVG